MLLFKLYFIFFDEVLILKILPKKLVLIMLPKSYPLFKRFSTGFSTICWFNLNFYVQNKILSSFKKKLSTNFFWDHYDHNWILKISSPNPMNPNDTKKDLNPEIKKELEKSKLEVLTNENDFLVKNLKKAGWSTKIKKFS